MCGLFGVIGGDFISRKDIDNFKVLAFLSSLRGVDSTGVSIGNWKKEHKKGPRRPHFNVYKAVENPVTFVTSEHFNKALNDTQQPFMLMGHCRAATVGDVNHRNAHPFWSGSVIGAHNGTIPFLSPPKVHGKEQKTDSECFIELIAEKGIKHAHHNIGLGAYACTWTDRRDSTLNLARNVQRTLYLVKHRKTGTLYWASERDFLMQMINRSDEYLADYTEVMPLTPNFHYKLDLGRLDHEKPVPLVEEEPKEAPSREDVPFNPPFMRRHGPPSGTSGVPMIPRMKPGDDDSNDCQVNSNLKEVDVKHTHIILTADDVVAKRMLESQPLKMSYRAFNGKILNLKDTYVRLNEGCIGCGNSKNATDVVWWYKDNSYICDKCTGETYIRHLVGKKVPLFKGMLLDKPDKVKIHQTTCRFCQ